MLINFYSTFTCKKKYLKNGKLIYKNPELKEIAKYSKKELDSMWEEVKRIENPHKYYVDLSKKLWILKNNMLNNIYF
mgnify:CR=1 FL=1